MQGLLALLQALTASFRCVTDNSYALYRLRVWHATRLILEDPDLLPFDRGNFEGDLIAPAEEGERLAKELAAAQEEVRIVESPFYDIEPRANEAVESVGPFWNDSQSLVRFDIFRIRRPEWFTVARRNLLPTGQEALLVLHRARRSPDGLALTVGRGTVWIAASLLKPAAQGFVGLRVTRARLAVRSQLPAAGPGRRWLLARNAPWTLQLVPEQPSAGQAVLGLKLPPKLEISHDGKLIVGDPAELTVPGGPILLPPLAGPAGKAAAIAGGIYLPLESGHAEIDFSLMSPDQARCSGRQRILSSGWLLPFAIDKQAIGSATSGGAIELLLTNGVGMAALDGTAVTLRWPVARLRLSAKDTNMVAFPAEGLGSFGLSLWKGAKSRFGPGSGSKLVSMSWTPAGQFSLVLGPGRLSNRWDLPRAADNSALQLPDRNLAMIGLNRLADGRWLSTLQAQVVDPSVELPPRGLALPNLFVTLSGPRKVCAGGLGNCMLAVDDGFAWLKLDVRQAEPMLPDPYAANWTRGESRERVTSELDVLMGWNGPTRPWIRAQIGGPLHGPAAVEHRDRTEPVDQGFWAAFAGSDHPPDDLRMIDLSSNAQQFGIAIDEEGLGSAKLDRSSLLSMPMKNVRLFLQPQVHWEAVRNRSPMPPTPTIISQSQGMPAFAAAAEPDHVVALPYDVARRIITAALEDREAAALFSLPFGLRAVARLGRETGRSPIPPAHVQFHEPGFERKLTAATQIRLEAQESTAQGVPPGGEARMMAGKMAAVDPPLGPEVVTSDIRGMVGSSFQAGVPVHRLDLSGYGMSCFSRWRNDPEPEEDFKGVSQVRFDALLGRTSYEVIEVRSYLVCPQCRVVRTIVMDRANSGVVERFDSGWKAIDDGSFDRYVAFDKGLVRRFSSIRNIRILQQPNTVSGLWRWQKVLYDADAHLGEPGNEIIVPVRGHPGYIPLEPVTPPLATSVNDELTAEVLTGLFEQLGGPVGGAADGQLDLGQTLPFHVTGIFADRAVKADGTSGFVIAVHGTPALPAEGDWNCVRVRPSGDAAAVDPGVGVPVIRAPPHLPYRFRGASTAYGEGDDFGFLMATGNARVLFPKPEIDPDIPGRIKTSAPHVADPYALSQATGLMPPPAKRLRCSEEASFALAGGNSWSLLTRDFTFQTPDAGLAGAQKWQLERSFEGASQGLAITLNSASTELPWKLERAGADQLELSLPGFPQILSLVGEFVSEYGKDSGARQPEVRFGKPLEELRNIVNALNQFIDLPLPFSVDVQAAPGPTPAFDVILHLRLRIPGKSGERIDIGVGKFSGQFDVRGRLRASIGAPASGELTLAFEGDIQQGILPPALYAGGYFRFAITISDSADPRVELALATTASIGGDLIPGLIALEVTVRYGYTLVPETLQPGVMLGLEARAKLLSGLLGVSFRTDAMARIKRLGGPQERDVTIYAELRVVATIEVLWGLADEEEELHTQFEQTIPLAPLAVVAGAHPLLLATELL